MPTIPSRSRRLPGQEVQPARAVQEHEADVAPGVAEAVELRLADARVVVDRHLADGESAAVRLEHHLGGELHPGRVEVERGQRVAADRAHPAVRVGHLHAEEDVEHPGEDRVADEAVQERHRVAVDRALEARADDEVVAGLEAVDERAQLVERIRVVGVAHDDVLAAARRRARRGTRSRSRDAVPDTTIAPCAAATSRRGVGRPVVDDDDLACSSRCAGSLRTPGRRPCRPPPPRSGTG